MFLWVWGLILSAFIYFNFYSAPVSTHMSIYGRYTRAIKMPDSCISISYVACNTEEHTARVFYLVITLLQTLM